MLLLIFTCSLHLFIFYLFYLVSLLLCGCWGTKHNHFTLVYLDVIKVILNLILILIDPLIRKPCGAWRQSVFRVLLPEGVASADTSKPLYLSSLYVCYLSPPLSLVTWTLSVPSWECCTETQGVSLFRRFLRDNRQLCEDMQKERPTNFPLPRI